jgi:hypothetical protein
MRREYEKDGATVAQTPLSRPGTMLPARGRLSGAAESAAPYHACPTNGVSDEVRILQVHRKAGKMTHPPPTIVCSRWAESVYGNRRVVVKRTLGLSRYSERGWGCPLRPATLAPMRCSTWMATIGAPLLRAVAGCRWM